MSKYSQYNTIIYVKMLRPQLRAPPRSRNAPPHGHPPHLARSDSHQRFSSFETPPSSDHELQEFSSFDNTPQKPSDIRISPVKPDQKKKSYILVEEMPVQYQKSASTKKKISKKMDEQGKTHEQPQCRLTKNTPQKYLNNCNKVSKENIPFRFNYLSSMDKELSIIKEDAQEGVRDSRYSRYSSTPLQPSVYSPLLPSAPMPRVPKFRYHEDILLAQSSFNQGVEIEKERLRSQQMRLRSVILEQQNLSLKERVIYLELQLKRKDSEKCMRESEIIASKKFSAALEDQANRNKMQIKQQLLVEIASLQGRCREMKEEMVAYKTEKQAQFSRLFQQHLIDQPQSENSSRHEVKKQFLQDILIIQSRCREMKEQMTVNQVAHEEQISRLTNKMQGDRKEYESLVKTADYYSKFTKVFLDMLRKIPVEIGEDWSDKKKIAVGWRVVKFLIRKAMKLGLQPPKIVDSQNL